MANLTVSFNFTPDSSWFHGNEIWDKMGYNSACVKNFCEIFAPIGGGVSGMGYKMLPIAFFPADHHCHGNKIRDKIGYNSTCVRNFCEIFASRPTGKRSFGDGPSNAANCIFPVRPPLP